MRNLTRLTRLTGLAAATSAATLAFAGVASAAPAPQLSGSYSVTVTRTVSEGLTGQPVGPVGVETWTVTKKCSTPTTCTTALTRTAGSGKKYQLVLTHTAKFRYENTSTFTQTCRGTKGVRVAAGWSVTRATRVTGSHATAGRIDHFSATISTTYTPTSAGTTGGCTPAREVLTGKA